MKNQQDQKVGVVILAAGKGMRMQSDMPKVLHKVGGLSMIDRVVRVAKNVTTTPIVVVAADYGAIRDELGESVHYAVQVEQNGTGGAIRTGIEELPDEVQHVIVLCGDKPFVTKEITEKLLLCMAVDGCKVTMAYATVMGQSEMSAFYETAGRLERDADGAIQRIVEYKDATSEQRAYPERNVSFYCFDVAWLKSHLKSLDTNNAQHELYITDLIEQAALTRQLQSIEVKPAHGIGLDTPEDLSFAQNLL